ncbi:DNA-binding XRE family transcriptional regulator [Streptomyces sp. V4I23]|nr:DNA-binding XRE family transcriptional regulator [Streptomyces sp. V4I23]
MFNAVDALIAAHAPLPPPEERERLRKAHGLTQEQVAAALNVRRATVVSWENGRTEPRPPQREAYARLLDKLAELYPTTPASPAQDSAMPGTCTRPAAPPPRTAEPASWPMPSPAPQASAATAEYPTDQRPVGLSSAAATAKPTPPPAAFDPRFANGPLAVVDVTDGQLLAYCVSGLVLDVPAKSIAALLDWTLNEAKLGAPRLSRNGKDADPLIVLTPAACERYGLPVQLSDEECLSGRLSEGSEIIKQLARAQWQLTRRGFDPWARIYRPAQGGKCACVQLCIPSWNALDARSWGNAGQLPAAELAQLLGTYATREMTPRGSTAVTGLELMTALRPPTRASEPDADGGRHGVQSTGSLGKEPVDCTPCEAPDGHPLSPTCPASISRPQPRC